MDAVTPLVIVRALDGLSARAETTAANIANASTRGYRPLRVAFETALRDAAARGPDAVAAVRPQVEHLPPAAYGSELRVDLELATASETALRYGALIDLLGRQMGLMRSAIAGGR
ncbi:flagellar basal body rod protein FlgB [Sphingomonas sp. VNH70]|uniref:flagellar basal body rod protein FlgB n=1 Tax=Sphingomonas silueang TaxID=3156617 RepID=UPI0032B3A120